MRAEDFINSIGIAAHLENSVVGAEPSLVQGELSYLGITNLRVEAPYTNLATYIALGEAGVRFDVITSSSDIPSQLGFFNSIAPYIASIEGINEINSVPFSYDSLSGPAADEAFQADLYQAIKADPTLTGIPVLAFSLSVGASEAGYNSMAASADYGNLHAYTSGGGSPNQSIAYQKSLVTLTPGESDYLSETGYYTLNDGSSGVSDAVQAIYLVDSVLDGARDGLTKTFLYELMDETFPDPNNPEGHYGVFTSTGQAKPAVYAIHNLTTLLADSGSAASTFNPAAQAISVAGLGAVNGFSQVFAKSSGEIDVALWAEPNLYNPATGSEYIFSSTVTLSLGGSYNVLVYDPVVGLSPIGAATDVTSFQVALGDDALIVELTPVSTGGQSGSGITVQSTSVATTAALDGVWLNLTANATDAANYAMTVTSLGTSGTKGVVTLNATATNGALYSPGAAFTYLSVGETATDTFTYTVSDGHGGTATATATVTITGVNQAPVAKNDAAATIAPQAVAIGLLANATDVNRDDSLSVTGLTTTGTQGSVTLGANGVATYTPGAAFQYLAAGTTAIDSFGYTVSDNHGASSTATTTVTITGTWLPPVAAAETASVSAAGPAVLNILAGDSDPQTGQTLSLTGLTLTGTKGSAVLNADGTVTYTPGAAFQSLAAGATATDSFGYTVSDSHGASGTGTETLTVTGTSILPVANADSATTTATTGVWIGATGNDTHVKGYTLSVVSLNTLGTRGTATLNPAATNGIWYSPNKAFAYLSVGETATDAFTYTVSDGHGGTATATDTVTITGVNQAPVARNDGSGTTASQSVAIGLLGNATDANRDDVLSVTSLNSTGTKGGVSLGAGSVATYTPGAAFQYLAAGTTATDSFGYTVSDNHGATSAATTTVTITGTWLPPVAAAETASVSAATPATLNILDGDSDPQPGQTLSLTGLTLTGTKGAAVLNANGTVTYTAGAAFQSLAAGATATDSFRYTVSDSHGVSSTGTQTLTVTGAAIPPVANPDSAATTATSGVWIGATNNDIDVKRYVLSVASVNTTGTIGTATLNPGATNGIWYSPGKAFAYLSVGETATDRFTYTVSDGHGGAATATDTITITGVNQAPVAKNGAATAMASQPVAIGLLASATDVNRDDVLSVTGLNTTGTHGGVTLGAGGVATYTPGAAFQHLAAGTTATDSFGYTVTDNHGAAAAAATTVTIIGTWLPPVAAAVFAAAPAGNDTSGAVDSGGSLLTGSTTAATAGSGPTMQFLTAATGTLAMSDVAAPANSATSLFTTVLNTGASPSNCWAVQIDTAATLKAMAGGVLTHPSTNVHLFTPATNDAQLGAGGTASFSVQVDAGNTAASIAGRLLASPTS